MSRIPLLPKWVLPSVASIYDLESATMSEMVPKLYGTMRDLVSNYNDFAEEVNEQLQSFTGSTNEEIENFKKSVNERLRCKFEDLDQQLSRIQLDMKKYTDTTLQRAFDVFGATVKKFGENLLLTDATDEKIRSLNIYGKTTQSWEPVPDYPTPMQSVGDSGSVTVEIGNGLNELQMLTIATPEGLPGIPVDAGGNYTDATGQQWVCDEIDLKRGVYVQNVMSINLADIPAWYRSTGWSNATAFHFPIDEYGARPVEGYETKADLLCNRLSVEEAGRIAMTEVNKIGIGGTDKLYISIEGIDTSEALVKYFKANNTIVLYPIATPIERPLATAELATYKQLNTYMPVTTVTTDSGAGILLEYVAIMQQYLENSIHDRVVEIATEKITEALRNGEIVVGLEYNEETEEVNIVAGGAE